MWCDWLYYNQFFKLAISSSRIITPSVQRPNSLSNQPTITKYRRTASRTLRVCTDRCHCLYYSCFRSAMKRWNEHWHIFSHIMFNWTCRIDAKSVIFVALAAPDELVAEQSTFERLLLKLYYVELFYNVLNTFAARTRRLNIDAVSRVCCIPTI